MPALFPGNAQHRLAAGFSQLVLQGLSLTPGKKKKRRGGGSGGAKLVYDATLGGLLSGCAFPDVLIPALHASSSQALVGMLWVTLCLHVIK